MRNRVVRFATPALVLGVTWMGIAIPVAREAPAQPAEPGADARAIATASSPQADRALARRLREIFAQIEGLADVDVEVTAGVVRLSGEVLSAQAREKAVRIAGQLQGVVEVEDELTEVTDLDRRLRPTFATLRERLAALLATLPLLAVALAAGALLVGLGRLATAWEAPYARVSRNRFARDLLRQAVRVAFVLAGVLVALEILDATRGVAAVAGAAGLAGLAVGFAFRDLAENYIASVLMSMRQPFVPNDHVVIEGREGHVVRLTSRATILIDLEGNHVRIPNSTVFKGIVLNYTRNPRRRFDFTVGVGTDVALADALALGIATLERTPGVLGDPPPFGWIDALGDSNVVLHLFAWTDQREAEWAKVRGEAIRAVKEAYDAAGICMPEPTLAVREAAAAAPARRGPAAAPVPAATTPPDIAPDETIDREVAGDRAEAGAAPDLLDPSAPRE